MSFIVKGGVYKDMTLTEIVNGTEENYGPFALYCEAYDVWRAQVMKNIDDCQHRLIIIELL
jgi:hypothetical protein